jgi:hypothetical protein
VNLGRFWKVAKSSIYNLQRRMKMLALMNCSVLNKVAGSAEVHWRGIYS